MKRKMIGLLMAASAIGAVPATVPTRAVAKSCSSGWKHAVISGSHKCLRRGQFCARGSERQYHRHGYHCHKQDARGNYHLS